MSRVELDMSRLMQIANGSRKKANAAVQKLAQETEKDAKANFNSSSPSPPGEPPGVVTGNLKSSVIASSQRPLTWVTNVGAEYADDLEFGTVKMAARPWFLPAIERVLQRAPSILIKVYE